MCAQRYELRDRCCHRGQRTCGLATRSCPIPEAPSPPHGRFRWAPHPTACRGSWRAVWPPGQEGRGNGRGAPCAFPFPLSLMSLSQCQEPLGRSTSARCFCAWLPQHEALGAGGLRGSAACCLQLSTDWGLAEAGREASGWLVTPLWLLLVHRVRRGCRSDADTFRGDRTTLGLALGSAGGRSATLTPSVLSRVLLHPCSLPPAAPVANEGRRIQETVSQWGLHPTTIATSYPEAGAMRVGRTQPWLRHLKWPKPQTLLPAPSRSQHEFRDQPEPARSACLGAGSARLAWTRGAFGKRFPGERPHCAFQVSP